MDHLPTDTILDSCWRPNEEHETDYPSILVGSGDQIEVVEDFRDHDRSVEQARVLRDYVLALHNAKLARDS